MTKKKREARDLRRSLAGLARKLTKQELVEKNEENKFVEFVAPNAGNPSFISGLGFIKDAVIFTLKNPMRGFRFFLLFAITLVFFQILISSGLAIIFSSLAPDGDVTAASSANSAGWRIGSLLMMPIVFSPWLMAFLACFNGYAPSKRIIMNIMADGWLVVRLFLLGMLNVVFIGLVGAIYSLVGGESSTMMKLGIYISSALIGFGSYFICSLATFFVVIEGKRLVESLKLSALTLFASVKPLLVMFLLAFVSSALILSTLATIPKDVYGVLFVLLATVANQSAANVNILYAAIALFFLSLIVFGWFWWLRLKAMLIFYMVGWKESKFDTKEKTDENKDELKSSEHNE